MVLRVFSKFRTGLWTNLTGNFLRPWKSELLALPAPRTVQFVHGGNAFSAICRIQFLRINNKGLTISVFTRIIDE